jgi:acyl carrier protein
MSISIKQSVLAYFAQKKPLPAREEEQLGIRYLNEGLIDSMGIIDLITYFEDQSQIRFEADDLQSEEFQTIGGFIQIVQRLSAEK